MVKGEDSQLSGCGFESWHRILDGCKRCQLLQLKINENKGSQMGHTKKIFKMAFVKLSAIAEVSAFAEANWYI